MKKFIALVLCVLALTALAIPAAAEQTEDYPFLYGTYSIEGSDVLCYGSPLSDEAVIQCASEGNSIEQVVVSNVDIEMVPTTYVCLIDCSTSLSKAQRQLEQEALQALSDVLQPYDRMVLVELGQHISVGQVLTSRQQREDAIYGEWSKPRVTHLYNCVTELMEEIKTNRLMSGNVCVTIFASGFDDNANPADNARAQQAIWDSGLPVYVVGITDPYPGTYSLKICRALCELTEYSMNGKAIIPTVDSNTIENFSAAIAEQVVSGSVLRINSTQLDLGSEEVALNCVCYDGGYYYSNITVSAEDVAKLAAAIEAENALTEPETTAAAAETTEPVVTMPPIPTYTVETTAAEESLQIPENVLILGGMAAAVLAVTAFIIAMVLRSRRDDNPYDDEGVVFMEEDDTFRPASSAPLLSDIEIPQEFSFPAFSSGEELSDVGEKLTPMPDPQDEETPAGPGRKIKLIVDSGEEISLFLPINAGKTLGRTQRSDVILNSNDHALSGLHCELLWDGTTLSIRDRNSTNGTFIGGNALKPENWVVVSDGAEFQAGSKLYHIQAVNN